VFAWDLGSLVVAKTMITVQVKLFATLRRLRPGLAIGEAFPVELPDGASVDDLIHQLELPDKEVKLVFVNGIVRDRYRALADGDQLGIFPPVGGG
jgi:molybdopterin converting factor small subunit